MGEKKRKPVSCANSSPVHSHKTQGFHYMKVIIFLLPRYTGDYCLRVLRKEYINESEIGKQLLEAIYTLKFLPLASWVFPLCNSSVVVDKIHSAIAISSLLFIKQNEKHNINVIIVLSPQTKIKIS